MGNRVQVGRAGELPGPSVGSSGQQCPVRGVAWSCAWDGMVLPVGTRSITAVTLCRGGSGPALPACHGMVVGRRHLSAGVGHAPGEQAEPPASQPRWVRAGPHDETRRSSDTAP